MTYRLRAVLPMLLLLLLLPLHALAEGPVSPLVGAQTSVDKGNRIALLTESVKNDYTWSTSDKKVATVDYKGRVTGRKAGVCTITAVHDDGTIHTCTVTVTQPVTKVSIPKSSISIDRGLTFNLEASVRPDDATVKTLVYSSSDASIASVDANGVVTALRAGKATITATAASGRKDSIRVTVTQPVTSIALSMSEATVDKGYRISLAADVLPADATNKKLTWTSSDKKIATVDSRGRVTGRKAGTCIVTATAKSGVAVSCQITVTQPVTKVSIPKSSISIDRGLTFNLDASIRPDDATVKTLTYSSSDSSVASVDANGVVTALRAGKATVTATAASGRKDSIRVTVTQPVTSIALSMSEATVDKGYRISLAADVLPADATNKKLTWTSSDKKIATVDSRGRVTGRKAGTCIVTATAKSGVAVSCQITVTQPVTKVSIEPSRKTIGRNSTYELAPVIRPDDATNKTLFYTSSHPHIASVDEKGVVTALADGQATITATSASGKKDTIRITVESKAVESLTLSSYYLTLAPGSTGQLAASTVPADASERRVRFHSDNPAVVTVSESGQLTAVGPGSANVTAVSADNSAIATACRVFVRDPNAKGRLSGVVIGINPGHQIKGDFSQYPLAPGSKETGNKIGVGCTGVKTHNYEYEINLQVGLMLRDRLEAEGATVVMTRTANDVQINNIERTQLLNNAKVDLALQLHCNSSSTNDSGRSGIELYVRPTDAPAYDAASRMLARMVAQTGALDRGVKQSTHYMSLNYSTVPAILVEMGYMSNPKEDVLLGTPSYQQKLVEGMYEGIASYCGR